MKINRSSLAFLAFFMQAFLFLPVAHKLHLTQTNYIAYLTIIVAVLIYNLISGIRRGLKTVFVLSLLLTLAAFIISGLIQQDNSETLLGLLVFGLVTGLLVAIVLYQIRRMVIMESGEHGFHIGIEIALSFFALSSYSTAIILAFPVTTTIWLSLILLPVSLVIGFVTSAVIASILRRLLTTISEKSPETKYLHSIPLLQNIFHLCADYFTRTGGSLVEIETLGNEIRNSAEDLSSASEEMNASLQEVSSTVQHIAKGAQDQSEAITQIAHSIEELDNLTTSISSQVKMANVSSRRTTDSAKKGMEFSVQQAKTLKEIFEQTKFIEEKMTELSTQATEIKKIVAIIQGITEQTDLLALNAAIEAARVGEQGKGFAVVADEIRNLANETQRSSTTVENLIMEINKTTRELSNLLNLEREKIDEANLSATQTEEEFTGIVKAVGLVTDMVGRINEAAGNQLSNTKELVKKVEQVAQVAADTAAATEQVSAAVEEQTASMEQFTSTAQMLSQIVTKLNEIVKDLKR